MSQPISPKRRALALLPFLLVGCKVGGGTETFSAGAACHPVEAACTANADCCSYACVAKTCAPNILEGGVCRTSNDCAWPMDCKSGACVNGATCRDDQDVCDGDADCCSGNCAGASVATQGSCLPNRAPVVELGAPRDVPRGQLFTLRTTATTDPDRVLVYSAADPDGDTLVLGWSLVRKPGSSVAVLSSATASTVTFTPDVEGEYELRLVVTDGTGLPSRLTAEDVVVLNAVNTVPRATVTAPVQASRNVSVPVSGTASDPDGDALTCTWYATPPGGVPSAIAPAAACAGATTASFVPGVEDGWTVTLEVTDGVHATATTATAGVLVVNDPPQAGAGVDLAWNLGAPTAPVAVTGSATDRNGDTDFAWAWTFDANGLPAASQLTSASITGAGTPTASFVPDATGTYRLRLRVSDRPGSFTEDTVAVTVDRAVARLASPVSDAAYARAVDAIVLVGAHPTVQGQGRLTILRADGTTLGADLSASPVSVATSPDGSFIAMGGASAFWWATVSGSTITVDSSTARGHTVPFSVNDVAVAGDRVYLLAGSGDGWSARYVWAFDTSSPGTAPVSTGVLGVRAAVNAAGDAMFVSDPYWGNVKKYTVAQSGQTASSLGSTAVAAAGAVGDLWVAQNGAVVYGADGSVRSTSTLAALDRTLASGLEVVDSTADGRAVACRLQGRELLRYDADHQPLAADPIPVWATDAGVGQAAEARFAFISSTGAKRYAVVWAGGRFGLVTYP